MSQAFKLEQRTKIEEEEGYTIIATVRAPTHHPFRKNANVCFVASEICYRL